MRYLLFSIATVMFSLPSFAGGSGGGHSIAGYIFFTYPKGGHVSFENQSHSVHLKQLCDTNGRLWVFGRNNSYRCEGFQRYNHLGGADVITISGSTQKEQDDFTTLLFSTKPFQEQLWVSRTLTNQESAALIASLEASGSKYKIYITAISKGKAKAVGITGANSNIYVIPGRLTQSEYSSTHKHLVVLSRDRNLLIRGELDTAPHAYTDVNGDGIPEIILRPDCDGNCWELLDISKKISVLATMSDH